MNPSDTLDGIGLPSPAEFTRTRADLQRWNAGDATAFTDLWTRYRPALKVLISGRLRNALGPELRTKLDVGDVLQKAALIIHDKLREFEYRGQGSLMAWMTQIAEYAVRDQVSYWQSDKRQPARERGQASSESDLPMVLVEQFADAGPGPSTSAEQAERMERVTRAMAELSERHHTLLFWRFFGGAQWSEIAERLGAPSSDAVRMECYGRALPALAAALPKQSRG